MVTCEHCWHDDGSDSGAQQCCGCSVSEPESWCVDCESEECFCAEIEGEAQLWHSDGSDGD